MTRQARALAAELGQKIGEPVANQVEETLHAAMVDEDAAKAVRLGMLVKPLEVTGTQVEDVVESVALPSALGETAVRRARPVERREPAAEPSEAKKPQLSVVADDSAAIEGAETALKEAEAELAAAERKLDKARRRVEKREAKGLQLQSELDELRRRIAELEQRVEANEDELTAAEEARDECEDSVEEARGVVERARKALEKLR